MTHKRIEYDPHAVARMRQRGFTRQDVRTMLAQGLKGWAPDRRGRSRARAARLYFGRREARVIYFENAERLYVVTVEWVGDPPGAWD